MRNLRNKNKATVIVAFLKKNWLWLLIGLGLLVYVVPFVYRKMQNFLADIKANRKDNETKVIIHQVKNETIQNSVKNTHATPQKTLTEFQKIKVRYSRRIPKTKAGELLWQSLYSDAENIAKALGTHAKENQAWFGFDGVLPDRPDPKAFFEDEKEAVRIAKKYPKTFDILSALYFELFTRSKNLKLDLLEYLSKSQIQEIRKSHKQFKSTWL